MSDSDWDCPGCGSKVPSSLARCDTCGHERAAAAAGDPAESRTEREAAPAVSLEEVRERIDRLAQCSDAARSIGVMTRRFPEWVTGVVERIGPSRAWLDAIELLEREAVERCAPAFEQMRARLAGRLDRLEAYSIDTRLERGQLEEAEEAWRAGELGRAIWPLPNLERVVIVKERHLEQTRDDLERLLVFLRDLEAIGLRAGPSATELAQQLEPELREGRLAPVRQRVRAERAAATERLRSVLRDFVTTLGDRLAVERTRGLASETDVRDLALGARQVLEGTPEDGARLLRRVGAPRGVRVGPAPSASAP
jgi:hypothetical protein